MSTIRKNMIANYAGTIWSSLMSVIFIPVYIKFMGIESYGLVGVFASLWALFAVLDYGLSSTMTREMARMAATDSFGRDARALTRTLEVIYWAVALSLGIMVFSLAGPIAHHWVKPDRLNPATVEHALMISGAVVALRWPSSFYAGGLRGLDLQPLLNLLQSVAATLRGFGAVAVLWLISPTIETFFTWQIVVSGLETFGLAMALWYSLPGRGTKAAFDIESLKRVWRFSAGITASGIAGLVLNQTDKIILSKMLSLELFGYYTLAWTVSFVILRFIEPIDAAVYPTLTRLVQQKNERNLTEVYHKSCQTQSVLLLPAALTLVLFGDSVLTLWAGNPKLTANTSPVLSILAAGICLNGFRHIPSLLQYAHGWTSLSVYQNLVSAIVLVPLMVSLTRLYQGVGAATVWVILNIGYVFIGIPIMHSRILKNAEWDWYIYDVAAPTVAALATALTARFIMPAGLPLPALALYVVSSAGLTCLAAVLATDFPRAKLFETGRLLLKWAAASKSIG